LGLKIRTIPEIQAKGRRSGSNIYDHGGGAYAEKLNDFNPDGIFRIDNSESGVSPKMERAF